MREEKSTVKVIIHDTEYPIKSVGDPNYIKEVAQYVDQKIKEIDRSMSIKMGMKTAVLAALNIADELFQLRRNFEELKRDVHDRSTELSKKIKGGLQEF